MVMPFGKYQGMTIEEIPSGYLRWIVLNNEDELQEAARAEFQWRTDHGKHFWD